MTRMRLQIDDQHGSAAVFLDTDLPPDVRAMLDELLVDVPRRDLDLMLALLIRQVADEKAYERVCAQRGLLL